MPASRQPTGLTAAAPGGFRRDRSLFVVFEGPEGAGKSTQAGLLVERLRSRGVAVTATREPGGTPFGEELRPLLLRRADLELAARAEALLMCASRAQLVGQVIRPALERGEAVVCDRFSFSTLAYQGYGRGLRLGDLEQLNRFATDGMQPDLIVLLDLPVAVGLARKPGARDRFEVEGELFHARVRDGYYALAKNGGERWLLLDAHRPVQELADLIWERVDEGMSRS
ncbi:MAG: dTMP kinase [Chloroflexi bacterium]|nr:dTMP kinase [Chloroflexota bacterium]